MSRLCLPLALSVLLVLISGVASAQQEVISAIQVHGNTITSDSEVIADAGLTIGSPFSDGVLAEARQKLRTTRRYESVEILKRWASITDPSQILLVIQVDQGAVRVELPDVDVPAVDVPRAGARTVRRGPLNLMFVPVLDAEDGYGVTYGVQFALAGASNATRRVRFPLTWGGDKRAAVEFQQEFSQKVAPRISAGAAVQRRTHPHFESDADRRHLWARGDWTIARSLHAGANVAWQRATLLERRDRATSFGADIDFDTRIDPLLPRNAVHLRARVDRFRFDGSPNTRTELDASGYVGLPRGSVLVLRALREDFSEPAPPFFKSILGGSRNLRGFRAGTAVGDTLVATSAEWRVPLTSPLYIAKFGTSLFVDAGTTYDKGQRLRDRRFERGVGGGVWLTAAMFRLSFMVARGIGSSTRVHFGAGVTF